MTLNSGSNFSFLRVPLWSALCATALLLCVSSSSLRATTNEPPVLSTIQEFWELPLEERSQPRPFRFELTITFYDPHWKLLWAQDRSSAAYFPFTRDDPALRSGARVRVEGVFPAGVQEPVLDQVRWTPLPPEPIKPPSIQSLRNDSAALRNQLVVVEGLVDRQELADPQHLRLTMSADGFSCTAFVVLDPTDPLPQYAGARVRVTGVCAPRFSAPDQLLSVEMMVASPQQIETLGWLAEDPRFNLPSTPIEQLPTLSSSTLVRVTGRVHAQEPGRYLRLRDHTGQVDVISGQMRRFELNEHVEAIGYPSITGTEWKLENSTFRPLTQPLPAPTSENTLPRIRLAAQVLELSPEEAASGRPITLSGIITWSHPDAPFYFIKDATSGICVMRGTDPTRPRPPGRHVEIEGVTGMGAYAPVVVTQRSRRIGDFTLPEARQISLEHALTGVEEAQWVEMRGYLRQVTRDGQWTVLEITTSRGTFAAYVPLSANLSRAVGAVVRLYGVCSATANERRKLTGIRLWVPSEEYVQIEEAAPQDPFAVESRPISSLGQFGSLQSLHRRVKVSGTVLLQQPGRSVYLGDDAESLLVLTRDTQALRPGDRIDAVGFPGRHDGRVVLREAVLRKVASGTEPAAKDVEDASRLRPDLDGQVVRMEGLLIDRGHVRGAYRLTVQTSATTFEAMLPQTSSLHLPDWREGSRVAVTGLYEVRYDDDGVATGFQVLLRSIDDVHVLAAPSWFTRTRVLAFAGALSFGILLFIGWIVLLRRQVHAQTAQIRDQLVRESQLQAELQRATRLESLGLLAGGIAHDFNNLLTIVMGNLSLASLAETLDAETARCLREALKAVSRAKDLTQQLLTFSKGGSPIRGAVSLGDIVREVADFALRGSKIRSEIVIPPDLWSADVDKGQIGQVVQNIVINAREAMTDGGLIGLELSNDVIAPGHAALTPGRYVRLAISDTGPGIPADYLSRIFEPYFTTKKTGSGLGLATVYSIVKKHHGHLTVQSELGRGSRFDVWLPAAETDATPSGHPSAPPFVVSGTSRGRILFMDDEPDIRRVGQAMFDRLGFETITVSDGAEAVQEFVRASASGRPYDVVVLDLTVPGGVGGRQAMEELLRIDPQVRAIVSSGYSNDQVLANYRQHGFRARVSKPYEFSDLERTVQSVLNGEVV